MIIQPKNIASFLGVHDGFWLKNLQLFSTSYQTFVEKILCKKEWLLHTKKVQKQEITYKFSAKMINYDNHYSSQK